jgi:hypothetical protein
MFESIRKFFDNIFQEAIDRTHITLEIHQGKNIFKCSKWFNFINRKKPSDKFTAPDLGIPSSCIFLYKKEGYIITGFSLKKDKRGGFTSIECKMYVPDDGHTTLARDLKSLRDHGWTAKE